MLGEFQSKLKAIRDEAIQKITSLENLQEFQNIKAKVLGRNGSLTEVLKSLRDVAPQDRPALGKLVNEVKAEIESQLLKVQNFLENKTQEAKATSQWLDVTMPGFCLGHGTIHPIRQVTKEIEQIFVAMGFSIARGPDVEDEYYNFEALNFPADHPARDMQDTFYVATDEQQKPLLLRTHTSPVQIRVMKKQKPPVYVIVPGAVYRHDNDVTHSPMFHQVEGLMVDEHITFRDLKGVLEHFCHQIFGPERKVRFRPSFFPFVEPGAEVDISCGLCNGKGCRVCSGNGWLEILGAGMVHPNVLKEVNVDPKKYSGFAFGMGVERIAMLKYGIDDIRLFYEGDLRFLEQF
ncbi:MAG: phenylalanine--tRNA ligase subunit alpha [Deltaproteobacteria bacterium]|nr:phenylalanine--tRNA ligase subunit alpha [Deltaproteobacteria bacterium]